MVTWGSEPQRRHKTRRERTKKRRKATQPKTCTVPGITPKVIGTERLCTGASGRVARQPIPSHAPPPSDRFAHPSIRAVQTRSGQHRHSRRAPPSARMRRAVDFLPPAESCCLVTNSLHLVTNAVVPAANLLNPAACGSAVHRGEATVCLLPAC